MNNQLADLQPLIYPAPVSVSAAWQLWLGLLLAVLLMTAVLLLLWRRKRALRATGPHSNFELLRQQALQELAQIPDPLPRQPAGPWLQQLNQLLKRLCSARYPEHHSHRLSGRSWLAFLDSRCPAAGLTRWMILVEGSYLPSCQLSASAITELRSAVRLWIEKHA